MTTHILKLWPEFFDVKLAGKKSWEARAASDRTFAADDVVFFREFDPATELFSGRELGPCRITFVANHPSVPFATFTHDLPNVEEVAQALLGAVERRVRAEGTYLEGIETDALVLAVEDLARALGRRNPHAPEGVSLV